MSIVYDHPRYYELAFSFRDISHEVDVLEECATRFARVPVHTFLELACGNSPHMTEILSRGYAYVGIDLNDQMLSHSRRKVPEKGRAKLVKADMCRFDLRDSAEFAYVALGSLYAQSTDDLLSHFQSLARVLPTGGLYLLDWCVSFPSPRRVEETWDIDQEAIHIHAEVTGRVVEPAEQLYEETLTLEITEDERTTTFTGTDLKRLIYPQEFLLFVRHCTSFEFLGWWNNWDMRDPLPSAKPVNRPIALLRRL